MPAAFKPTPFAPPNAAAGESSTQYDAMVAGKPYGADDKYLHTLRNRTSALMHKANSTIPMAERMEIIKQFVEIRPGDRGGVYIVEPFFCEYVS